MKLRKLELTNVRRFAAQKAQLGPFGDGLTTITAENEAGKSTFFDALHALLFVAHGSSSQEVKSLQPYSGGAVSVAAEIEIDGKDFRIEKTFNAQKSAKVIDCATGQIIKQQGDAEAWIEDNINKTNKGPTGLLWVRQGESHVDPEGKDKDAPNVATRRDLMSSVRGQIDAVTGGRRMDKIVARCRKDLDAMATKSLKAKAGSPWKQVEDKVEDLRERKARLLADVSSLSQALDTKRRTKARLRELQDPQRMAERAQQISKAADALGNAKQHDQSVKDAENTLGNVVARRDQLNREIKDILDARALRQQLAEDISQKEANLGTAKIAQATAETALKDSQDIIAKKEAERRELADMLSKARKHERARLNWDRLRRLAELTSQLQAPQRKLREAKAVLERPEVTQRDLVHLSDLGRRISVAQEQRKAQFASFSIKPSGTGVAIIDGETLQPDKETLVDRPMDLQIPGFGEINLRPAAGAGKGIEDPKVLVSEYETSLQALGFETLPKLRDALNARQDALNAQTVAIAEIRGLAPDGVDALNEEYATLCAVLQHPPDQPAPAEETQSSQESAEQIEETIAGLDLELETLRAALGELQTVATDAASEVAKASGVLSHLMQEQADIKKPEGEDARLAKLETARDAEVKQESVAKHALEQLKKEAPDLAVATSAHDRLLSADKADGDEINKLERELARVNGAIETQSEGAVEEKLAEVEGQLAKAEERAARHALQAKALALLIEHLDAARREAQETYFEPIRNELRPLLAQLHAGADFELDPEKMLVGKIIRNGVEDDVSVLSGGAYEQIAILTRLAFAKLFAKQGRQVPVILDDALVHTDDERISTMFNMLSQVARDQQIIVLSCRTRAFSDLGGNRAFIEIEAV